MSETTERLKKYLDENKEELASNIEAIQINEICQRGKDTKELKGLVKDIVGKSDYKFFCEEYLSYLMEKVPITVLKLMSRKEQASYVDIQVMRKYKMGEIEWKESIYEAIKRHEEIKGVKNMIKYKLVYKNEEFGKTYKAEEKFDTKDEALVQLGKVVERYKNAIKRETATVVIKDNIVIIRGKENRGGCLLEDFCEEYSIVKVTESIVPICDLYLIYKRVI